jgi:RNA polymerase sigma-70 factor, ECF subfamily
VTTITEPQSTAETARLLARARQGDTESFCRLAAPLETRLYQQAVALCGQLQTAEDLVAETMIEAWRCLERFDGTCRLSTWLYAILLHRYQKLVRRNRARPVSLSSLAGPAGPDPEVNLARLPDPQPSALETLIQAEVAAGLRAALTALPEAQQTVILLRFYQSASLSETAAALGVPLGTVKSRLHHALLRLREMDAVMNLCQPGGDT